MPREKTITRRRFLAQATAATASAMALPYFVPGSVLGLADAVAPSNRITVGMIGVGRQVLAYNLPFFMSQPDCEVVALCDVDRWRLAVTEERTASYYGEKKNRCPKIPQCSRYVDFREVLDRKDIDAVMISTPDHWHVPMSVMAVKAGKDVCCEKPLTRSIAEGRLLSDLVAKHQGASAPTANGVPSRSRIAPWSWCVTAGSASCTRSAPASRSASAARNRRRRTSTCPCRRT